MSDPAGSVPLRERLNLADQWRDYLEKVVPEGASEVQKIETRRAWYGGAASMFGLLLGELDVDPDPTELDLEYVEGLTAELEAFGKEVDRGEA